MKLSGGDASRGLVKANLLKNASIAHLSEKRYVSAFLLYRKGRVTPAFQDFIDRVANPSLLAE